MTRSARWMLAACGTVLVTALLLPAAADWLVTRRGERIETVGPWRVESRLVVFKRPDGSFASMRLSEVDLEASERLTREMAQGARAPTNEPEPAPKPVVARLTEKELPPVGTPLEAPDEAPVAGEGGAPPAQSEPEPLIIDTWREIGGPESPGLEFAGTVSNQSQDSAVGIAVTAALFDEEGVETASTEGVITSSALPPGRSAGFRASFPGVFHYVRVEFRVSGRLLRTAAPDEEEAESPPSPTYR